jgi:hypothetical protein
MRTVFVTRAGRSLGHKISIHGRFISARKLTTKGPGNPKPLRSSLLPELRLDCVQHGGFSRRAHPVREEYRRADHPARAASPCGYLPWDIHCVKSIPVAIAGPGNL